MKSPKPRKTSSFAAQSASVGEREIQTQRRVLAFLQAALGFAYLGLKGPGRQRPRRGVPIWRRSWRSPIASVGRNQMHRTIHLATINTAALRTFYGNLVGASASR